MGVLCDYTFQLPASAASALQRGSNVVSIAPEESAAGVRDDIEYCGFAVWQK